MRTPSALLAMSGTGALIGEIVLLRRASLSLGSAAVGASIAVAAWLGGMALGALAARRLPSGPRVYAALEALAAVTLACVVLAGPVMHPQLRWLLTPLGIAAPAFFGGATWPALTAGLPRQDVARGYAANTAGAVFGTLLATFVAIPALGVTGAGLLGAAFLATAAALALGANAADDVVPEPPSALRWDTLAAVAVLGFCSAGLEVWWMRLAAVGFGGTVFTAGLVLAVHLATVAVGAAIGARWPADPRAAVELGTVGFAVLALGGGLLWGQLPLVSAQIWPWLGPDLWWTASGALLLVATGGAPAASGLAFAGWIRSGSKAADLGAASGLGSVLGALAAGLWMVPALEARGTAWALAGGAALAGALTTRRWRGLVPVALLAALLPPWDARLYAVGLHLRWSDFPDPSPRAVARFVDEGWDLLYYDHGRTGAVAVGRSRKSGNTWLSIDGKVDASTGDDMPTQTLSAEIPLAVSRSPRRVLVVGLASGVTAGTALADPRVEELVVLEIEPSIVDAEVFFRHVNGRPLDDPRTTLRFDDARSVLQAEDTLYDVIVSEPSNPWIRGVSSLFTEEYWRLLRSRLRPGGVVCQWIQIYGLGPDELRGLLRTFQTVFPDAVAYETIEGADLVLVAGGDPAAATPISPVLDAAGVARVAGEGWINTDDDPRVEWRAPLWLHRDTSATNRALLHGP